MQHYAAEGKWLVAYGPKASVGNFYLPPLYYQVFVILTALFPSPFAMTLLITLVESLTPVLVFFLAKRFLDERAAVVAGVLAASAPLAVIFGTFAWNPNMVPFFSLLSLLMLLKYTQFNNLKYLVVACISFVVALQLHYQATVLLPVFVFIFLQQIFQRKFLLRHWLVAIIAASMLFLPYGAAEVANNFQNTRALYSYLTEEHARYFDQLTKNYFVWTFIPAFMERIQLQTNTDSFRLGRVLIFFGLPLLSYYAYKKKSLAVVAYFLGILCMLRVYKGDKVDYYMSSLFVLPSLLLASLFHWQKYLALPLLIFVFWISGVHLGKIEKVNQFSEVNTISNLLLAELPDTQAHVIIHDDDAANLIAFMSIQGGVVANSQSLHIIDVCKKEQPCFLYPTTFSSKSNMEAYTSELRQTGRYHYTTTITPETLPFVVHVGYLEQSPEQTLAHPLLGKIRAQQFGSDVLVRELFE